LKNDGAPPVEEDTAKPIVRERRLDKHEPLDARFTTTSHRKNRVQSHLFRGQSGHHLEKGLGQRILALGPKKGKPAGSPSQMMLRTRAKRERTASLDLAVDLDGTSPIGRLGKFGDQRVRRICLENVLGRSRVVRQKRCSCLSSPDLAKRGPGSNGHSQCEGCRRRWRTRPRGRVSEPLEQRASFCAGGTLKTAESRNDFFEKG